MDESDGRLLLALAHIQTDMGFTRYRPGEFLPPDHPDAAAWVEAGSAKWVGADYAPPVYARAMPATAPAGLPGMTAGSTGAREDLVGRIPDTYERGGRR